MTILWRVWHNKKFLEDPIHGKAGKFPNDFNHVATVFGKRLDNVFEKTNHIDHDWTENPEIMHLLEPKARSTSVGDVITNMAMTKGFRCAPVGWTEEPMS